MIGSDPVQLNNPVEKWRKKRKLTIEQMAKKLGYESTDGYHKFIRCQIVSLRRIVRAAQVTSTPVAQLARYWEKNAKP